MIEETREKENADLCELERSLTELEADLTDRYCSLGKQVLEVAEKEDRAIGKLVDQIIEVKKELSLRQHMVQCPHCLAHNQPGSRYCSSCGEKLMEGVSI